MQLRAGARRSVSLARRLLRLVDALRREDAGVAAIEFAFAVPVLLTVYAFLVEFSRLTDEARRLSRFAQSAAIIISQQASGSVPPSVLSSTLGAAALVTAPYDASGLSATASVVDLTQRWPGICCNAKVSWSFSQGGAPRPCMNLIQVADSVPPAPSNILASVVGSYPVGMAPQEEVVVVDVVDQYQPVFAGLFGFLPSTLHKTAYIFVRQSGKLTLQQPVLLQQGQSVAICP